MQAPHCEPDHCKDRREGGGSTGSHSFFNDDSLSKMPAGRVASLLLFKYLSFDHACYNSVSLMNVQGAASEGSTHSVVKFVSGSKMSAGRVAACSLL